MQQFNQDVNKRRLVFSAQKLGQQMIIRQDFYFKLCQFTALVKSFQSVNYRLHHRLVTLIDNLRNIAPPFCMLIKDLFIYLFIDYGGY